VSRKNMQGYFVQMRNSQEGSEKKMMTRHIQESHCPSDMPVIFPVAAVPLGQIASWNIKFS